MLSFIFHQIFFFSIFLHLSFDCLPKRSCFCPDGSKYHSHTYSSSILTYFRVFLGSLQLHQNYANVKHVYIPSQALPPSTEPLYAEKVVDLSLLGQTFNFVSTLSSFYALHPHTMAQQQFGWQNFSFEMLIFHSKNFLLSFYFPKKQGFFSFFMC